MFSKKLMFTIITLVSVVSFAQNDGYVEEGYENVEIVEENVARDAAETAGQESYGKVTNDAYDSKNSPQINIYNANSNANKQHQKSRSQVDAQLDSATAVDNNSEVGNDYILRANDIRRSRKDMEIGTEQKMIEKIEYSRMEDERDRANRLFGNRLDKNYNNDYKQEKPQVIVVEKPVEYAKPAPAPAPAPVYEKNEVSTTEPSQWWGQEAYIAPMVGSINYSSADNVRPDSAFGVAVGSRFDSNVSVEASFLYSNLEMDDYNIATYSQNMFQVLPGLKDVTQYGFGAGVKYNFDIGRVSPFIGALAVYNYREYEEMRAQSYTNSVTDSTAFDAGLNVGVDVKIAKNLSLGAEYRWMKNLTYDRSEQSNVTQQFVNQQSQLVFPQTAGKSREALEELGSSAFLINGKFSF